MGSPTGYDECMDAYREEKAEEERQRVLKIQHQENLENNKDDILRKLHEIQELCETRESLESN